MFGVNRVMLGKVTSGALKILLPAFISVLNLFIIPYTAINHQAGTFFILLNWLSFLGINV